MITYAVPGGLQLSNNTGVPGWYTDPPYNVQDDIISPGLSGSGVEFNPPKKQEDHSSFRRPWEK
jgi:hypothetical protein